MPIRPENKALYPQNWKEIVARINKRAGNCCEICGARNHEPHPITGSMVVLTTMHMSDDITDCSDYNLKAACQKCHNSYDAPARAAGVKRRKAEILHKCQGKLFEGER
jgi:hypothetical protein